MALDAYQQAHKHLGTSKNILVIAGAAELEDTYPAAVALAGALAVSKKEVAIFAPQPSSSWPQPSPARLAPDRFFFLKNKVVPQSSISSSRGLVVSIDTSQNPVASISYSRSGSRLDMHVIPERGGRMDEQDVHISLSKFNYDAIITIGVLDLESLGDEFTNNASLFYETTVINIDKSPSNELYGEVNIIEPTFSSCSEISSLLLAKWDEGLVTKDVATALLAGIIHTTGNFQNSRTKPSTLSQAAYLMSRKADQQKIVRHLFKTKSFEFLKLWGVAMSKLKYIESSRLAWFCITQKELAECGANTKAIPSLLGEIKNNFALPDVFVILWENHSGYFGLAHSANTIYLEPFLTELRGEKRGDNAVFVIPSKDPSKHENTITQISRALEKKGVQ